MKRMAAYVVVAVVVFCSTAVGADGLGILKSRVEKYSPAECSQLKEHGENGPAPDQVLLGIAYLEGYCGLGKDPVQAAMLFRLAAAQGNPAGQVSLGTLYLQGVGVAKNEEQGVTWLRKAAEAGDGDGQAALGQCYEDGLGLPRDANLAVELYQRGALAGSREAEFRMGMAAAKGLAGPADNEEAIKWLRRAADQSHVRAMTELGKLYMMTGKRDLEQEAVRLITTAAEANDPVAQVQLGDFYRFGLLGTPKNAETATAWYERAEKLGSEPAESKLKDLRKLTAISNNEPAPAAPPVRPKVDRSATPQAVTLKQVGLTLQIHDPAQQWYTEMVGKSEVLRGSNGVTVAVQLIEDLPCKTKIEAFSTKVVSGRSYVPPGWYKDAGEDYNGNFYVGDLCLHFRSGLVSAMVLSRDKWDSPTFLSAVPLLDAVRVAAVAKWGPDATEAETNLVPLDDSSTPAAQSAAAPPAQTASNDSPVIEVLGVTVPIKREGQWKVISLGSLNMIMSKDDESFSINLMDSPLLGCDNVVQRLAGKRKKVSNNFASNWYKDGLQYKSQGTNNMDLCLDLRGRTLLATMGSGSKGYGAPIFKEGGQLLEALGQALIQKEGKQ